MSYLTSSNRAVVNPAFSRNQVLDDLPLSVFEPIVERLRQSQARKIIPLHQGKTAYTTKVELRPWSPDEFEYPPYHDGPTRGSETLIGAICSKLQSQSAEAIDPHRIQVTCGITHALSITFRSILRPGDEVLILSPQWLFANGLVRAAGGTPVEVPFFPTRRGEKFADVEEKIAPYLSGKVRAIYFNSPNCPTGRALPRDKIRDLSRIARANGAWLISDNAYEYFDYSPDGFYDPALDADTSDITFSAYSFSKSFGLTGYRIGYLLSPNSMAEASRKCGLYSIYSVPTCCQFVALSALRSGPEVLEGHRKFVKTALETTTSGLQVPATAPDGGFYAFLALHAWEAGVDDFIGRCIAEGVSLAPGRVFGKECEHFARLCYAVVGPADLREGLQIINRIYRRGA